MAKDHFIRARVSGKEKEYILYKARTAYMTESEFVRTAALGKDITVIEGADALLNELRHQGNNLNQLTIMARQGQISLVDMEPFMEVYERTWQTLNSLLSLVV